LPAVGGNTIRDKNNAPQHLYSSLDLPQHKTLKKRLPGQNAPEDINKLDLKLKLKQAELDYFNKTNSKKRTIEELSVEAQKRQKQLENTLDADDSSDEDDDQEEMEPVNNAKINRQDSDAASSDSDSDSDSDDEDDTALLLAELEKIKAERLLEKKQEQESEALVGNPLLEGASVDFSVKKRWDDDVIFKNQSKGNDGKDEKRFINDLLRSDFHRKFMTKYIR
jgi:protein CWC15